MLPKSYLKFIAASMVYESDLSKYAKIQAMRFIENASMEQLNIFISECSLRPISEEENISEKYLLPAVVLASALAAGRVAYDQFLGKAAIACAQKKGDDRKKCMRDFRLKSHYAKVAALKREMGKCGQTNNVKKCRDLFIKQIRKIEKQVQKDRVR